MTPLVLRDLPPAALLAGDVTDPAVADAALAVERADAIVIVSPVYKAAYSGLLKVFLDLLPQFAFRGKSVLPLGDRRNSGPRPGGGLRMRPVLNSLGADHIGQGWFVLSSHIRVFCGWRGADRSRVRPSGGGGDREFPGVAGPTHPASSPLPPANRRVSPAPGAPDLTVLQVQAGDPELAPLLDELVVEYGTRYGRISAHTQLTEVPASDFLPPDGAFLVLTENGQTIAGGAIRRYDQQTAEVKRVWTSSGHRRRGLGRRLMAELEHAASELGYRRIHRRQVRGSPKPWPSTSRPGTFPGSTSRPTPNRSVRSRLPRS